MLESSENRKSPPFFLDLPHLVSRQLNRLSQTHALNTGPVVDDRSPDGNVGSGDARHTAKSRDDGAHAVHAGHSVDVKDRSHDVAR